MQYTKSYAKNVLGVQRGVRQFKPQSLQSGKGRYSRSHKFTQGGSKVGLQLSVWKLQ